MDMDIEPTSFDLIILGTGLPEAIIAGASALAGKRVLHLDSADSYGSHWSTWQLDQVARWEASGGQLSPPLGTQDSSTRDPAQEYIMNGNSREKDPEEEEISNGNISGNFQSSQWEEALNSANLEAIQLAEAGVSAPSLYSQISLHAYNPSALGLSRSYGLDLASPRLALCAGPLVELLINGGAHNYLEFKPLDGSYMWTEGALTAVPASRADVFQDRSLSLVDKRHLMRFFKMAAEYTEAQRQSDDAGGAGGSTPLANGSAVGGALAAEDPDMPFVDLLRQQKLPEKIRAFVLYAIAMVMEDQEDGQASKLVTAGEGLQCMALYLSSIGRFGVAQSPFLYPLYGQGELAQAFCRVAAVKGALYVLRRPLDALLVDKASGECRGIRTGSGQHLLSPRVVLGPSYSPQLPHRGLLADAEASECQGTTAAEIAPGNSRQVARCLCVTDAPLVEGQATVLVTFPPKALGGGNLTTIRALQVGSLAQVSPPGRFVVQLSSVGERHLSAEEALQVAVNALFHTSETTASSSGTSDQPTATHSEDLPHHGESSGAGETENPDPNRHQSQSVAGSSRPAVEHLTPESTDESTVEAPSSSGEVRVISDEERGKPSLLWCLYYIQQITDHDFIQQTLPSGVWACCMPDETLDYRSMVAATEKIYHQMFPDDPFFAAPTRPDGSDEDENEMIDSSGSDNDVEVVLPAEGHGISEQQVATAVSSLNPEAAANEETATDIGSMDINSVSRMDGNSVDVSNGEVATAET